MAKGSLQQLGSSGQQLGAAVLASGSNPDGTPFVLDVRDTGSVAANTGSHIVDAGTVLTVPATRVWRGVLVLQGAATGAIPSAASVQTATLTIAGTGASPAAGVVAEVVVPLADIMATATVGSSGTAVVVIPLTITAGSAAATVTLSKSAGMTAARASARGQLVAL